MLKLLKQKIKYQKLVVQLRNAALTANENKIPDVSSLLKKTNYNLKITEIEEKLNDHNHGKYITNPEFNKFSAEFFDVRLTRVNLITKTDFDGKLRSLNQKNNSNETKHLLVENELKKLKTFDSNYFRGKNHFEEDGTQNDLVFQPMYRYFKRISSIGTGNYIYFLKYKGLSDENVTAPNTSDYSLNSQLSYLGTKTRVGFKGSCLKQDKITYVHGKVVNIYIAYEINENLNISSY